MLKESCKSSEQNSQKVALELQELKKKLRDQRKATERAESDAKRYYDALSGCKSYLHSALDAARVVTDRSSSSSSSRDDRSRDERSRDNKSRDEKSREERQREERARDVEEVKEEPKKEETKKEEVKKEAVVKSTPESTTATGGTGDAKKEPDAAPKKEAENSSAAVGCTVGVTAKKEEAGAVVKSENEIKKEVNGESEQTVNV